MCSIAGLYTNSGPVEENILRCFIDTLRHRGPDDQGIFIEGPIGLAHTRLSVQDLTASGHQPMMSQSKRFVICFNGEIYNHKELRSRYLPDHRFNGTSDTETLVELFSYFMEKGNQPQDVCREINGMFAIALWDRSERKLHLIRDRMGIKPLYILREAGLIAFASEIKALRCARFELSLSADAIRNYFTYGHSCLPSTIYKNVRKIEPATIHSICENGETQTEYWSAFDCFSREKKQTYESAKGELVELLNDAVRSHLISDVPFGAFLSGGLDSSAIVALMQKWHSAPINTFSVAFDIESNPKGVSRGGKYSELHEAAIVARQIGSNHHEIIPSARDLIATIEKIAYHYDEPFGDPASFPTYMVSALAKRSVTVVLTGEGADELFGGYRRYKAELWREKHHLLSSLFFTGFYFASPFFPRIRRLRKIAYVFRDTVPQHRYSRWLETLDETEHLLLTGNPIVRNDTYTRIFDRVDRDHSKFILLADQLTLLTDGYLEKVDKASMAHSLEARVPFLDHRIVEFANMLPIEWKIGKMTKRIFRDSMRGILPEVILTKAKRGFTVPVDEWLRGDLKSFFMETVFDSSFSFEDFGLKKSFVEAAIRDHCSLRRDYSLFLWQMLMFVIWAQSCKKHSLGSTSEK
jgi:asparagine synthase (glutamine-hydrolysing)